MTEFCVFVSHQRNPAYAAEAQPAAQKHKPAIRNAKTPDPAVTLHPGKAEASGKGLGLPALTPEAHRRRDVAKETALANRSAVNSRESSAVHKPRARADPALDKV